MQRYGALIALTLLLFPMVAEAQFMTGNQLLRYCVYEQRTDQAAAIYLMQCIGYIEGVVDDLEVNRFTNGSKSCIPTGSEAGQARDVVVNYLKQHPADRGASAALLVVLAVGEAWGCAKK